MDDDLELMRQLVEGNMAAGDALYLRHSDAIVGYLIHQHGSPELAEDVFHETFLKCIENAPNLIEKAVHVRAWLFEVARNKAIDMLRSESRRHKAFERLGAEQPQRDGQSPGQAIEQGELQQTIRQALSAAPLTEREREVIRRTVLEGQTLQEVSDDLGTCVSGVHKSRVRGLIKLRELLQSMDFG